MAKIRPVFQEKPIDFTKVRPATVARFIHAFELEKGGTLEQQVVRIVAHQEKTPLQYVCDCMTCGGASDMRISICPYCGDGGLYLPDLQLHFPEVSRCYSAPDPMKSELRGGSKQVRRAS